MKKKILIVDDSPVVLSMLGDTLSELNYAVTTAENGIEACRHAGAIRFNMIITDLNMPGMDGIELTKRIKQIPNCRLVPLIMLSSEDDEEKIKEARMMGISTFLRKPIEKNQLKSIMQIVIGS